MSPRSGHPSQLAQALSGSQDSTHLRSISGELATEWWSMEVLSMVPVQAQRGQN